MNRIGRAGRWISLALEAAAGRVRARWAALVRPQGREAGMATAEYAVATLAAVAFAGVLLVVVRSPEVRDLVASVIRQALSA